MWWYSYIIIVALVIYAVLLYAINIYGSTHSTPIIPCIRKIFYSLSFTAYGSAWMLLAPTEVIYDQPWRTIPLFLGPALAFIFFHRAFIKILIICQQQNVTSFPDFIAKRYGNSQLLAVFVTLVCLITFTPYIALQIKAIMTVISAIILENSVLSDVSKYYFMFGVLACLAFLVVIIAGKQGSTIENHYKRLLFTSTFNAIIKLIALIAIGGLAYKLLIEGAPNQNNTFNLTDIQKVFAKNKLSVPDFILQTAVMMASMICLPHLVQTGITKVQQSQDLNTARWLIPLYLLISLVCTIAIMSIGQLTDYTTNQKYWFIFLPINNSSTILTTVALLGCFAAAVGTTIICCFALARIVCNHILLVNSSNHFSKVSFSHLQNLRWACIIFILALSSACYLCLPHNSSLNDIGQIAFAGIVQLFPAVLGALYWKTANKQGVLIGLIAGMSIWFITLLFPLLLQEKLDSFATIPFLTWVQHLLPFHLYYINVCTALALLVNFTAFFLFSVLSKKRVTEHWQASKFINQSTINTNSFLLVKLEDLLNLTSRFIGNKTALEQFINLAEKREVPLDLSSMADDQWIFYTEHLLAERLGTSTARAMVKSAIEGREVQMEDVLQIVDEASEVLNFNRMFLQGALEHISQGISVVNKSLHIVAWNQRYLDLFNYPSGLIQVGRSIADIIYYNAKRGMCGEGSAEEIVTKRLKWLSLGQPHTSERVFPSGQVIEIIGNPMPGGGFVTSFADITAYKQAQKALQGANEHLEQRVKERTKELSELNQALTLAKSRAEQANESKSRFLTAVGHDLMQPLNAARLFSASLSQEHLTPNTRNLVNHLESSLHSAEELIADLLDISRIESGHIIPKKQTIALNTLFDTLQTEFSALTPASIKFKVHNCGLFVNTDPKLLRRILQNFLTNAFRYGEKRIILGVRRLNGKVRIEIWDQGPGIPADKQKTIFEEFKRLDSHKTRVEKGLGLGLTIADGFCKLLDYPIEVRSWLDKATVFSVTIPIEQTPLMLNVEQIEAILEKPTKLPITSMSILCIDNEDTILTGMETLLTRWGCCVTVAHNQQECSALLIKNFKPQLLLVDYHLDNGYLGTDLISWLRKELDNDQLPAIIISADNSPELMETLQRTNLDYIKKPIKPAKLRALLSRYLALH